MKCENCGKHAATIKYTQEINGVGGEIYLCERCARDMNIDMNFNLDFDLGFNDVFSSLFGDQSLIKPLEIEEGLVCDACGTSYDEFTANGMLGCENCYRIFNKKLDAVIKRLHGGNNRHVQNIQRVRPETVKKKDVKEDLKTEIEKLREELAGCIKVEDYEKAAILRDKIKALEKTLAEKERGV
ncbi:MAG: UvrB/UvrC motif-containing protein [Clostridia bacterium]|nr:UvrB/UvrC motif-containing protein [Clostridia bacterium]